MATYWENSCSFGLRFVSWYMYLIVSLVFSHLGFWSGNLFLIAPFPDLCLLVPLYKYCVKVISLHTNMQHLHFELHFFKVITVDVFKKAVGRYSLTDRPPPPIFLQERLQNRSLKCSEKLSKDSRLFKFLIYYIWSRYNCVT